MSLFDDLRKAHTSVRCYTCGAEPDARCVTKSGKPLAKPHAERIKEGTDLYTDSLRRTAAQDQQGDPA